MENGERGKGKGRGGRREGEGKEGGKVASWLLLDGRRPL